MFRGPWRSRVLGMPKGMPNEKGLDATDDELLEALKADPRVWRMWLTKFPNDPYPDGYEGE